MFNASVTKFELVSAGSDTESPQIKATVTSNGTTSERIVNAVLIAVGRVPNVEGLDLERAGIAFSTEDGI